MQKILMSVFVCIFYFSSVNCVADEKKLTKLETELLNYVIISLQSSAIENIRNDNALSMFENVKTLSNTISSSAYVMILSPGGKILAHNIATEATKVIEDEVTKKVLKNRDSSEILIQKLKLNNRDALDFSLPVFSASEPNEYLGAVRFAIYLN